MLISLRSRSVLLACLVSVSILLGLAERSAVAVDGSQWRQVPIPEVWKKPPAGRGGYSWYRCLVRIPKSWRGRELRVFVEPVDDAREAYLNGVRVGTAGSFPPKYRSGLGAPDRHAIDPAEVRFGELNLLALRIYSVDSRTGFNVAAPVLFGGDEAIRCAGQWEFRAGDDRQWSRWDPSKEPATQISFSKVEAKTDVDRILRRLPGEDGPLPVADALQRFQTPDDLVPEIVLSEPEIGQPLFMDFDERGRLWVLNYQQYPNPAGLTMVSRDKYLRAVYDQVPPPPPNHFRGRDNITIHEDTNADGVFDKHVTFVEGLNIATSFARGRGGLFVLNPPYLLYYADANQDDVPDGDPQVLLEGFGLEDSHSVANNLRWGPDGWLYAAQGSTVTGQIRRYGSKDKPVHSMGQLIWRYHPETRRYEIFAEGGGNAFGVEIDSKGRIYSGNNGGDTRGFHYVQGGYYRKGFGKHGELSNPYTFGYFPHIQHHSVPRFTHTFIIYEGAGLSAQYAGRLFGVGPLQGHVVISDVQPLGASFQTRDIDKALTSSDPWFRPVQIKTGPDGAIYVCDFYEQRIDHASHYQGRVTPESGRIYRLRAPEATPGADFDYAQQTANELIELLRHENKWHRQIALRLLADRRDESVVPRLLRLLEANSGQLALEALWALNLSGGFDESIAADTLRHQDPHVRQWTVRLLCDDSKVSPQTARQLIEMAGRESNVEVRCQLACSARRLPTAQAMAIVRQLLEHDADANDVFLPLLLWWAVEAKASSDRQAVIDMLDDAPLWDRPLVRDHLLARLMRRFATAGGRQDLLACAQLLEMAPAAEHGERLMQGFETAYAGRTLSDMPAELFAAMAKVGGGSLALRLRRADEEAIATALETVKDEAADEQERIQYALIFGQIDEPRCVPVLLHIVAHAKSEPVRSAALTGLQAYDLKSIGNEVIRLHEQMPDSTQATAQTLLASRKAWSLELLYAVNGGLIDRDAVSPAVIHRLLFHDDAAIMELVSKLWGNVQSATSATMRAEVERFVELIGDTTGNPYRGKKLYLNNCGKCHVLFTDGGKIGPNLTSYKRDDLRGMLMNIVNPSLEIREGFENFVVFTSDGRMLNGFIADQDSRVVVLKGADAQTLIIPREEIDDMQAIPRSIMPEGILKKFTPQQIRDLFAYLRATQPLP